MLGAENAREIHRKLQQEALFHGYILDEPPLGAANKLSHLTMELKYQ